MGPSRKGDGKRIQKVENLKVQEKSKANLIKGSRAQLVERGSPDLASVDNSPEKIKVKRTLSVEKIHIPYVMKRNSQKPITYEPDKHLTMDLVNQVDKEGRHRLTLGNMGGNKGSVQFLHEAEPQPKFTPTPKKNDPAHHK